MQSSSSVEQRALNTICMASLRAGVSGRRGEGRGAVARQGSDANAEAGCRDGVQRRRAEGRRARGKKGRRRARGSRATRLRARASLSERDLRGELVHDVIERRSPSVLSPPSVHSLEDAFERVLLTRVLLQLSIHYGGRRTRRKRSARRLTVRRNDSRPSPPI